MSGSVNIKMQLLNNTTNTNNTSTNNNNNRLIIKPMPMSGTRNVISSSINMSFKKPVGCGCGK